MRMSVSFIAVRLLIAWAVAGLSLLAGASGYVAGLAAGLAFVGLLVLHGRGRYLHTGRGAVLARDERGRAIADRAARNGFVVLILAVTALSLATHGLGRSALPVAWLDAALAAGSLAWIASDLWQRRG